jgi:hypothetical protein
MAGRVVEAQPLGRLLLDQQVFGLAVGPAPAAIAATVTLGFQRSLIREC